VTPADVLEVLDNLPRGIRREVWPRLSVLIANAVNGYQLCERWNKGNVAGVAKLRTTVRALHDACSAFLKAAGDLEFLVLLGAPTDATTELLKTSQSLDVTNAYDAVAELRERVGSAVETIEAKPAAGRPRANRKEQAELVAHLERIFCAADSGPTRGRAGRRTAFVAAVLERAGILASIRRSRLTAK
jgi:hypothetical protein